MLLRLGVVLDRRNDASRLGAIARMCERAGLDSLLVPARSAGDAVTTFEEAVKVAAEALAAPGAGAVLAVDLDIRRVRPDDSMVAALASLPTRRVEYIVGGADETDVTEIRRRLSSPLLLRADDAAELARAARLSDGAVLAESLLPEAGAACDRAARERATFRLALELPLSIGRTEAEARARAAADPLFPATLQPEAMGIFGTLEEGQRRVQALARAGVTDLWCALPNRPDVHDLIAQMTALAVGSLDRFRPDQPASTPPAPPRDWGGRPRGNSPRDEY